jgi:5'(3')-deoxyribonucleotidase
MITTHDSTAVFTAAVEYMADKLFKFTEYQAGVMCGRKAYTLYFILVLIPQPFTK